MAVAELREHSEALSGSWEAELERLAEQLERLPADAALADRLELSQQVVSLLCVGLAAQPGWLAQCCRVSAAVGEPVLASVPSLDQQLLPVRRLRLAGLADRSGQRRPLRVSVPAPTIPADDEPEAALEPPAAHPPIGGEATPKRVMRPLSERRRPADPEAAAAWRERQERIKAQAGKRGPMATAPARELTPELELELEPPQRRPPAQRQPSVMPSGFLRAHEAAELLGVSTGTISRWRKSGRFGEQGPDWRHLNGRDIAYSVAAVERLEQEAEEAAKARIGELLTQLPPCAAADRG